MIEDVVRELGGDPEATDAQNLQLLANEIVILREKLRLSEDAEVRAERHRGHELEARSSAEKRARIAERTLERIDSAIARAKHDALAAGTPMHLPDEQFAPEATDVRVGGKA
jgi:hypothetical protein